jgi:hypothetical protein
MSMNQVVCVCSWFVCATFSKYNFFPCKNKKADSSILLFGILAKHAYTVPSMSDIRTRVAFLFSNSGSRLLVSFISCSSSPHETWFAFFWCGLVLLFPPLSPRTHAPGRRHRFCLVWVTARTLIRPVAVVVVGYRTAAWSYYSSNGGCDYYYCWWYYYPRATLLLPWPTRQQKMPDSTRLVVTIRP